MTDVARMFSRAAETYDRGASLHRHVAAMIAGQLPEAVEVGAGPVLELGSGTGVLTGLLLRRYPSAVLHAVDVAPGMVQCLREQFLGDSRVQCIHGDARTFRASRPYRLVASSSALHWAVPIGVTMRNIHALTAEGGRFCAALMMAGTLAELHAVRSRVAPGKLPPVRLVDEGTLLTAMEGAGFLLEEVRSEVVHARYASAQDFLQTIHAQGLTGGDVSRGAAPLTRGEIRRIIEEYDRDFRDGHGGVHASYNVLCVSAARGAAG